MPLPEMVDEKVSAAQKKIAPIDGIAEQGVVPDPAVMHTLFAKFMAIAGPVGILPVIFAMNSFTVGVNFAAATMGAVRWLGAQAKSEQC